MLPEVEMNTLLEETEIEEEFPTSRTYRLDEEKGEIVEKIDGLEAIEQALRLILRTERSEFEIYGEDHGAELTEIIGQPASLACVNLEDAIKEALLQDDRVESVENFSFARHGKNAVLAAFTVIVADGRIDMEQEVELDG